MILGSSSLEFFASLADGQGTVENLWLAGLILKALPSAPANEKKGMEALYLELISRDA